MRGIVALALALPLAACELQEVTLAEPDPFIVVEAFLVAGDPTPVAGVHASAGAAELLSTLAGMALTHEGEVTPFVRISPFAGGCLALGVDPLDPEAFPGGFGCYEAEPPEPIGPERLYRLDIVLDDGSRLAGATRVPGQVEFTSDAGGSEPCYLAPATQVELSWHPTAGAAAYLIDLQAFGVAEALQREGIVADVPEPLVLRGLAIGDGDTTIVLPREFGLFDRFTLDAELLLALQRGMPEGISFNVTVAAIDQNFVNWVRGGDFNPSGLIRTPSMFGEAGTGVIASMTLDFLAGVTADEASGEEACGS